MVASIVLPASSTVVYRLPPVLSRLYAPSCATCSKFQSRPYRFPVFSGAFRTTFPSPLTVFRLSRATSARRFRSARTIFSLCRALFDRRSFSPGQFPVALCVTRWASVPVRPVSHFVPCRAFCAHNSFFRSTGTTVLKEQLWSFADC